MLQAPCPSTLRTTTAAVAALRAQLAGRCWLPSEQGYRLASPWQRSVPVQPAAVVAAAEPDDIVRVVRAAHDAGYRVAVQATGHGAVPLGGDAVLVHTGRLTGCVVDARARTARIGPGTTWQQVLSAAAEHGLAPVCGSAVGVGAVGYLSGGGIGPLARTLGVSSDYLEAVEMVTGDGSTYRVTREHLPELFWSAGGAKSLLGIVLAAEVRLLPIPEVYGGTVFFAGDDLPAVLPAWRDWAAELPMHAGTSLAILQLPAVVGTPAALAGRTTVAVRYASIAATAHAENAFRPLLRTARQVFGGTGRLPWTQIGTIHADPEAPSATATATCLLPDLDDGAIDHLVQLSGPGSRSPQTLVELRQLGGALDAPRNPASAFDSGGAGYNLFVSSHLGQPAASQVAEHAERLVGGLHRGAERRKLVNFTSSADPAELRCCFDASTLGRLHDLSRLHDPRLVLGHPMAGATRPNDAGQGNGLL